MPFVALQPLGVGHGPALVVLVDERLAIVADLAGRLSRSALNRCARGRHIGG